MRVNARPNGKFLTLRLADLEYGIPYAKLREWVLDGKIPRIDPDVAGRCYLIRRVDLEAFLESNMTAVRP